jgi:hypothetical protein
VTARIRFANGQLDDVAHVLCATHPHAAQYIEQAPLLALVTARKFGSHVSYGERDAFAAHIGATPKLRDLLAVYGLPLCFRKIGPAAIRPTHQHTVAALAFLDPSTLSQCIPSDSQGVWLDGIRGWLAMAPKGYRTPPFVAWIARRLSEDLSRFEQVDQVLDYLGRGNGELNERWSWARALEAVDAWHVRLHDERATRDMMRRKELAKTFDDVICRSALPDQVEVDGLLFTVLRTIRKLRENGQEMRHCVASYAFSVKAGDCAIVAVTRDGVGVATLEIDRGGRIVQLKGPCNQAPLATTRKACDLYALLHWRAPETPEPLPSSNARRAGAAA